MPEFPEIGSAWRQNKTGHMGVVRDARMADDTPNLFVTYAGQPGQECYLNLEYFYETHTKVAVPPAKPEVGSRWTHTACGTGTITPDQSGRTALVWLTYDDPDFMPSVYAWDGPDGEQNATDFYRFCKPISTPTPSLDPIRAKALEQATGFLRAVPASVGNMAEKCDIHYNHVTAHDVLLYAERFEKYLRTGER